MGDVNAARDACIRCGKKPAAGFATINEFRYCHGDDDASPTCYERAQFTESDDLIVELLRADRT